MTEGIGFRRCDAVMRSKVNIITQCRCQNLQFGFNVFRLKRQAFNQCLQHHPAITQNIANASNTVIVIFFKFVIKHFYSATKIRGAPNPGQYLH